VENFNYAEFDAIKFIDKGGFGNIYKATFSGKDVVLKDGKEVNLHNEITLLKKVCPHPNINSLLGITKDPKNERVMMVLNYANEGNFFNFLQENWLNLSWKKKIKYALEIANGLEHLHKFEIIHCDLHPKNILVDNGVLKITDLGCSKIFRENSVSNSYPCGIIAFVDPQCFISLSQKFKRNYKSDIYSFGMIMWFISTGRMPFKDINPYTLIQEILKGLREEDLSQKTPPEYIEIYKKCWDLDPEKRPQLIEIKEALENLKNQIELCWEYSYDSIEPKENLQISQIKIPSNHIYSADSISYVVSTSNFDSNISDLVKEFRDIIIKDKLVGSLKTKEAFLKFMKDHENEAPKIFNSLQAMQHEQKDLFLAISYFHGFGVEKNVKKYLESLEKACSKDVVFAISELATCYFKGVGVEKNLEKAFELYKISVERGFLADKCLLSEFYYYGIGGAERDPKLALHLLKRSATVGYVPAMYWLGYCYQYGVGVTRDFEKAVNLYREVIQNGDYKDARKKLE
ncbi:6867_t:CDS:2, partial [Acaulospora morrowiae]